MTKVIIVQGGSLESYFDLTMDYLHAKYHRHQSNLPKSRSLADDGSCSEYFENLVDDTISIAQINNSVPSGKLVI